MNIVNHVKHICMGGFAIAGLVCFGSTEFHSSFRDCLDITRKNMNNFNQTMSGFMSNMQQGGGGGMPLQQPSMMQQFNPALLQQDPLVLQSMIQMAPILNHLLQIKPIVEQLSSNMNQQERQLAQLWTMVALQQLSVNSLPPNYADDFWRTWRKDIRGGNGNNLVYAVHAICVIALIDPAFAENLQGIMETIQRNNRQRHDRSPSDVPIGRATPKYA